MKKTSETKTIPIGTDSHTKFLAFGDDSHFRNILVYAFAIIHRGNLRKAETQIKGLKEKWRIPMSVPIHSYKLFHADGRRKAGIGSLSGEDARRFVHDLFSVLNEVPVALRYSYYDFEAPGALKQGQTLDLELEHISGGKSATTPFKIDPKGF